jgi:hypothetical protein
MCFLCWKIQHHETLHQLHHFCHITRTTPIICYLSLLRSLRQEEYSPEIRELYFCS